MARTLTPLLLALAALLAGATLTPAPAAPPPKRPRPVWPVPNPSFGRADYQPSSNDRQISGVFGPRLKWGGARYDHHEGLDFYAHFDPALPQGNHAVFAVLDGVVTEVIDPPNPERTETGRKVVVTHDVPWSAFGAPREWGPVRTGYLHLSALEVQQGQRVRAGEPLGRAGETGYTSTVHLHFNAYRAGGRDVNVNPARLFSPKLFPHDVTPLHPRTVEVEWLEWDMEAGTVLARVLLPFNAYTLDGFALQVDRDTSRAVSFEHVSAEQRAKRDTGDEDLFPGLKLFPLRYNGGGTVDRVNASNVPRDWPMARYPVEGGKGVRLGFDLLATGVPPATKKLKLYVLGVLGEKVTSTPRTFRNVKR